MKKVIHFLLSLLIASSAYSQGQMVVKEFNSRPNDLTAQNRETRKVAPQDGRNAALIKIVTNFTDGFTFDAGSSLSVVDVAYKPGEIWLYMPSRAQKITINHDRFGSLRDYRFPIPIESGKTYEMILDPGVGKYANITTTVAGSPIYLDGDSIGKSPVIKTYVLYGKHKLHSKLDRMEGNLDITVKNDGIDSLLSFTIDMVDQSIHYGKVSVVTEPDARIFMNNELLGVGSWNGELRKGTWVIETRKENCDPQITRFTVKPQQTNFVEAAAPIPHKGYLSLYTRPRDTKVKIDGKDVENIYNVELPVGNHVVDFKRKSYYDMQKEYVIEKNVNTHDTINMQHVQYVTENSFYFGGSFVAGTFSGPAGIIGGRFRNIDLQLSYMFGITKTNTVNYYNTGTNRFLGSAQYSLSSFGAKLGYQIAFSPIFGITPQVGYAAHFLSSSSVSGKVPDESTSAACATVGGRFVYAPMQRLSFFAAPEYDIPVSKGKQYADIADAAGFSAGGFFCHLGILITF